MSSFDASLPSPIAEDLATALALVNKAGQGAASYLAPGASEALPFILRKVGLSGGSNLDTVEYPFFGGWSSEALNEKPQGIKVEGSIAGTDSLIKRRNAMIEAFRKKATDEAPGYLILPSWGRFPVLIAEWDVSEEMDKQGRYELSLTCTRAGLSESKRGETAASVGKDSKLEKLSAAAQERFVADLSEENLSTATLGASFNTITTKLLGIVGRMQGAQSLLNSVTSSVLGISSLVSQGIRSPKELALACISATAALAAGAMGVVNDVDSYFEDGQETAEGETQNTRNALLAFLANASFTLDDAVATARELTTRTAAQNLYRAISFYAAATLLPTVAAAGNACGASDDAVSTYEGARNLFDLFMTLEASIDRSDPTVWEACADVRIAVATEIAVLELYRERSVSFARPLPEIVVAADLGLSYESLVFLNRGIADSFLVRGKVLYV